MIDIYRIKLDNIRKDIETTISPLLTGNIHLTNLPFHANLGDALIWQGSEDFIHGQGRKILSRSSFLSFRFPKIDSDDVIVLNGGGSFGDVWRMIMDFFIKVIEFYPHNRIILFPQSAWYDEKCIIAKDAEILSRHNDLHLIARDKYTYNLFKSEFKSNKVYIAPDMAFAINPVRLLKWQNFGSFKATLYLKRIDKEWNPDTEIHIPEAEISDWPTLSKPNLCEKFYFALVNRSMYSFVHSRTTDFLYWPLLEKSARIMILNRFISRGAEFISPFETIVTTRLHVLILSVLLGKQVRYIDNITGKLSAFCDTWLKDFENVKTYES